MRTLLCHLPFICLLSFVSSTSFSSNVKIGVVDIQKVILSVSDGKLARENLQKKIKAKEFELKKKKDELDKMNQNWKKRAALMSEEAKMKAQNEFQQKFMALRNEEMQFQNQIKQEEVQATQKIARPASAIINEMGKEKGFDLVFESSNSGILYARNPVDLTDEVIKKYEAAITSSNKKGPTLSKK